MAEAMKAVFYVKVVNSCILILITARMYEFEKFKYK